MASKIRTIKPEYFKHELLNELEVNHPECKVMLFFAGLWGQCDANGVFRWRPKTLSNEILPFIDYPVHRTLEILVENNFIKRFMSRGKEFGMCTNFDKHQRTGAYERKSAESPDEYDLVDAGLKSPDQVDAIVQLPVEMRDQSGLIPMVDQFTAMMEQLTGEIWVEQTCINEGFEKMKFLRFIRTWGKQKHLNGTLYKYPVNRNKDFIVEDYKKELKLNKTNGKPVIKSSGEYVAP